VEESHRDDAIVAGAIPPSRKEEKRVEETPAGVPDAPVTTPTEDTSISFEEFMRVELRVAKVLAAEAVPKSKKLLKVTVDAGTEHRTIVAGIAGAYQPEQLVGRTVVIVANLRPAKLMGVESQGMVLAAGPDGSPPVLMACDDTVPPGTRVR
jgi:methionyl-tRNA synthetase